MISLLNCSVWILALLALGVTACTIDTQSLPKIDTESFPKIGGTRIVSPVATSVGAATPIQATNMEPTIVQSPTQTTAAAATPALSPSLTSGDFEIQEKIALLKKASRTLAALAAEPAPIGLDDGEAKEFAEYSKWLKRSSEKMDVFIKETEAFRASNLMQSTKEMQEMNQSFNLQYLGLQQKMQAENRQFTMISNIMKTKHDTARNAINNVR